jgi:hypothetical protein
MTRIFFVIAVVLTLLVTAITVAVYIYTFGVVPSHSHQIWAEFGDYLGGLLNPIFAMLAFLALLLSITLQSREFRSSFELLTKQTEAAREQLTILKESQVRADLFHVIKDIDARLDLLLKTVISRPDSPSPLTISHMVTEAKHYIVTDIGTDSWRTRTDEYRRFINMVIDGDNFTVEVALREIIYLVQKMRVFLKECSQHEGGSYSPMVIYYADRCYQLLDMLEEIGELREDIGSLSNDIREFFATVGDSHG